MLFPGPSEPFGEAGRRALRRPDGREYDARVQIRAISASSFSIPLLEPFTISRASVDSTRAAAVRAEIGGAEGFGEAALPLGAPETVEDLLTALREATATLAGRGFATVEDLGPLVDGAYRGPACGRSAIVCALYDALARRAGLPLHAFLGSRSAAPLVSDITLPIADPARQEELATAYWARGFRAFKVKVGADRNHDEATVRAVARATPEATLRFDANEGFAADDALALVDHTRRAGLAIECFEQPCRRDDHAGLRAVRAGGVPVVADESVARPADLEALVAAEAVDGINLKLVKMGGIDHCLAIGRRAREHGLSLMVGAMIESRLGLTAMAHVVAALGGVDWVDLDTAFLLASDPVRGGMITDGPRLTLPAGAGLDLSIG
jgi:L-Ala-D/L-Glu epimerase